MIVAYVLFLAISIAFFYFTSGVITNGIIRFIVSLVIFFALSISITVMVVSKGDAPPPGSKTIDFEEMERIRRNLNKEDQMSGVKIEIVTQRDQAVRSTLLEIWEASVAATHDFLAAKDIQALKPHVSEAIQSIETLAAAKNEHGIAVAFMGVERDKIEMLFVAPQARGTGIGRELISYAVDKLNARYVDVNEQNPQAAGFYEKMGFEVFGRSELDAQGNPYPLLRMRLKERLLQSGGES
ncbi:MAG: acetyltransferase [Synergistaceae bacterium]|jgi:putative acetyltransferase|nr:acetyltransferase [Synergistaceae bacterium]